jgi:hypothetical protein
MSPAPFGRRFRPPSAHLSALLLAALAAITSVAHAAEPPFVDVAESAGIDFVHFNGMTGEKYLLEVTGSGGALFDYDGDGDLDVYLVQSQLAGPGKTLADALAPPAEGTQPRDRLYRNDSVLGGEATRLRFTDVTERSGLEAFGYGMSAVVGDYDNDGDVDLYVANFGSNQLWRNRGDGTFEEVTEAAGADDIRWTVPATFVDYDGDGWLDLFLGNYVDFSFTRHRQCLAPTGAADYCAPLAYKPEPDRLLRNRGDGTFEDVTRRAGIHQAFGNALGAVSADFNGDGRLDIYVANDMAANQLWTNQGDGTFLDDGLMSGSALNEEGQPEASMGVVVGDVDADGDLDLFMTHLEGETNTLYLADGFGGFVDETRRSGLGQASFSSTAFGTAWVDIENDGWLDLIIANGAVSGVESQMRSGELYPLRQPNQLFRNLGGGQFAEITSEAGELFELSEVSRGVAVGDIDNDGDTDVLLANNSGPARLLVNRVGQGSRWLGLNLLDGGPGTRSALGARVSVERSGQPTLERRVQVDGSYASSNDPRVLVGLGAASAGTAGAERVVLVWPGGESRHWSGPALARYVTWYRARNDP